MGDSYPLLLSRFFYFNLGSTWGDIIYNRPNVIYQQLVEVYLVFIFCDIDTSISYFIDWRLPVPKVNPRLQSSHHITNVTFHKMKKKNL